MNPFPKRPISLRIRSSNKCISISSSNTKTLQLGGFFIWGIYLYTMKLLSVIKEMVLMEQPKLGFISMFPTVDTLTTKTSMGYNPIGGTNNTNIIYLTRRDETTGNEIPNSKFSYKLSGSYGFIGFDIILRNVSRNRGSGELIGQVMPKSGTVAGIMKKLIPSNSLTKDGWLQIRVPVDKLNAALVQLHSNKGSSAEIKVGSGIEINLTKV
jgi:hypothetical protein